MAIEDGFKTVVDRHEKPERPADPGVPFVNYTEEEIESAIKKRGITRERFYEEWHAENTKLRLNYKK